MCATILQSALHWRAAGFLFIAVKTSDLRTVNVGFMVDKVTLRQVLFSASIFIPPVLRSHSSVIYEWKPTNASIIIQFISYVWWLLHVSALYCHPQGAFLEPAERCSIEVQSIKYYRWVCCVWWRGAWWSSTLRCSVTIWVFCVWWRDAWWYSRLRCSVNK
jgi:hypothetical protein